MPSFLQRQTIARRRTIAALAVSTAAGLFVPCAASPAAPPSQFRSATDVRQRQVDEHDRPYFRETQSHRGWEIREPQYTVFAATSAADAKTAAAHVAQAWREATQLAGHATPVVENPDFGLSALQVTIDAEPLRDRDAPLTTVNVVGIRTQVQINTAPGQPNLQQQLLKLREGVALAALHTAGLDSAAPPWVMAGLAAHAGRAGLTTEERQQMTSPRNSAQFGGQQWRFERSGEDALDYQRIDHEQAAERVEFLLTGNDAVHAPAFLAALQSSLATAESGAARGAGFTRLAKNPQPAATDTSFDQLAASVAAELAAWKENSLGGQPIFEPAADTSAEIVAAEREMLVLLKLQRRFSAGGDHAGGNATGGSGPRTKVVTFDKTKGATTLAATSPVASGLSYTGLVARLTDPAQPAWATLDVDGSLLLSSDKRRVQEMIGGFDPKYSSEQQAGRTLLVRRLEGQRMLHGWLEANPKDKTRPLAKFEVVDLRVKAKPIASDTVRKQVSTRGANGPH